MRIFITFTLLLLYTCTQAATKTWNGGASGSWSNASNWSPVGVPVVATSPLIGDDIIFDGSVTPNVTITDYPAQVTTDLWGQLTLSNGATVDISSASNTYMYFGTGLTINTGCRINIGAATSTFFEFGNKNAVANSGLIYGTVELKGTGTNASTNRKYYVTSGRTRLFGKLIISGPSAQLSTAVNWTNLYIENGGELQWAREGVTAEIPSFTCVDGGVINVTGLVTLPVILNTSGTYSGLIIWNCPGQTGERIPVVPSVGIIFNVDSVRIVNTGTGSACLGTTPCYSVGHLEVQSGVMHLGSLTMPLTTFCTSTKIVTDIKVTGGTLIGNATFTGDTGGAYPFTLAVNGSIIVTGGTFNLTNRPTGLSPGGAMQLNVKGNFTQTGGSILASSAFGSQNQINMNGSGAQTLELNNMNDIGLSISNTSPSLGVTLTNNVSIASSAAFILNQGYVKLSNYTLTVPASRFFQNSFTPMPRIVTSGYGKLKLTGITASSTKVFPVAPFTNSSYDPVTITTTAGASTNDYSVRVQRGIASAAIYSNKVINRTWIVNGANTINANTVGLTYQYNDTSRQPSCLPASPMEEGHFAGGVWNVDPASTLITPTGSSPYIAGPFYPNSIDSSFAIGNLASILAIKNSIQLSAQKNSNSAILKWTVDNATPANQFLIERSADGSMFTSLSSADVNNLNYTNNHLLPGLNYYRIKMIDVNGVSHYSNVVAILNAAKGTTLLSISPNPVTGSSFKLQLASAVAQKMNVQIVDMLGRFVVKQDIQLSSGFNTAEINVSKVSPGSYYIYGIDATDKTKVLKFIKQ